MDNSNPFSPGSIAETITNLPKQLQISDDAIVLAENHVDELQESMTIAITNVSLNAPQDGKNAEQRKLQTEKAIAESTEVKAARAALLGAKIKLEQMRAENKQLSRSFAAWCHVAELKAAQMILMSKGVTK